MDTKIHFVTESENKFWEVYTPPIKGNFAFTEIREVHEFATRGSFHPRLESATWENVLRWTVEGRNVIHVAAEAGHKELLGKLVKKVCGLT